MNTLPHAIGAYIDAANARMPERLAALFHADASVLDEGAVRHGRDEIAAWARETGLRYRATITPAGLDKAGDRHRLRAVVAGDFPGSPITLHFHFLLQSGRIGSLEIKP